MAGRLVGEVAIVTGSTSGLGAEIARLMADEGAKVMVTGRDPTRGEAVVGSIAARGGDATFVRADLSEERDLASLVGETTERHGRLTVLVNNAVSPGVQGGSDGPVGEVTAATWESILRVNVVAAAMLCRLAIPQMLAAEHGSIVNVSSRAAERGTPRTSAYSASKGALNALTRSITADYGRVGIRCNTVQPGYVLHERRDADLSDDRRAQLEAMHLTRLPNATDVAWAVVYLASREAEVVSGVTLAVDGGSSAVRGRTLG
ncbi:MAG: SDR family NAD(P)-dependent oxidoreductase [Acidimicrobiales bacterium]